MRVLWLGLGLLAAVGAQPAAAEPGARQTALNFAVMRNGQQIGTSTFRVHRDGGETIAEIATHIRISIVSLTVYHFDQTASERWEGGRLLALNSRTDDNGTAHHVTATRRGGALIVEADGKSREVDPNVVPVSLWNVAVLGQHTALNPNDGTTSRLAVTAHGTEQLTLQGRATPARHFSIVTSFTQDVWYDESDRLVRVELRGSDGSRIQYLLG